MALHEQEFKDLSLSLNDKILYCADSIGLDLSRAEIESACKRTGDIATAKGGQLTIKGSVSGLMTAATGADAAANVTSENLADLIIANTEMDYAFGSDLAGEAVYSGTCVLTSVNLTASVGDYGKYSASLRINSITKTINP